MKKAREHTVQIWDKRSKHGIQAENKRANSKLQKIANLYLLEEYQCENHYFGSIRSDLVVLCLLFD